jgi:hypothetical protein
MSLAKRRFENKTSRYVVPLHFITVKTETSLRLAESKAWGKLLLAWKRCTTKHKCTECVSGSLKQVTNWAWGRMLMAAVGFHLSTYLWEQQLLSKSKRPVIFSLVLLMISSCRRQKGQWELLLWTSLWSIRKTCLMT